MCFGRFDSENSDKKKIHPNLPMYGNCFAPKKNFPSLKFEIESYAKKNRRNWVKIKQILINVICEWMTLAHWGEPLHNNFFLEILDYYESKVWVKKKVSKFRWKFYLTKNCQIWFKLSHFLDRESGKNM